MMQPITFLLFWSCYCRITSAEGSSSDLSMLTTDQTQIWLKAISQINNTNEEPHIKIIRLDDRFDIPLYKDSDNISDFNRHVFKQNINKRVQSYLYKNQLNSSLLTSIYDPCHGTLSSRQAQRDIAGVYVYTGNPTSSGLGIMVTEMTSLLQWFNGTKVYVFDKESKLKNGTQLILAFETVVSYNSNSDLIRYNQKTNEIVQQATISITDNLQTFLFMENLSCQRHQQISDDDRRSLTFACTVRCTFQCPLNIGSTCWLEDKAISNIHLNINSLDFVSDQKLTVRIDV